MEVHSRALRAEVELCRPCQGAHWTPVWVKSGPSLAKGPTKRITFRERGTWPKHKYLLRFGAVGVDLGVHWSAQERFQRPCKRRITHLWWHKGTRVHLESMETVANGRKWTQMDANGWKQTQTQAGSEVKIYLKAKTYD